MATETQTTSEVGTDATKQNESGGENSVIPDADSSKTSQDGTDGGADGGRSIETLPQWAQKEIKTVREEAARRRVEAKNAEEKARLDAMSEQEKAIERVRSEERSRTDSLLINLSVEAALAKADIINPEKSGRLLDLDDVRVNDQGKIEGLDAAVATLIEDFPNLVAGSNTNPALGNRGSGLPVATSMNDVIRGAAGRG